MTDQMPEFEVLDADQIPVEPGRTQRRLAEAVARKAATQRALAERLGATAASGEQRLFVQARQRVAALDAHDDWIARLGPEAVQTHRLAKQSAFQSQMGLSLRLNQELLQLQEELFDDIASRPDAFWFAGSMRDHLGAWLSGTSLALEDRGLAPLTVRESLRQLVLGDAIDRRARVHDETQSASRRARRIELRAIAQLTAAFAAQSVGAPAAPGMDMDEEPLFAEGEVEELVRDLLRSRHAGDDPDPGDA